MKFCICVKHAFRLKKKSLATLEETKSSIIVHTKRQKYSVLWSFVHEINGFYVDFFKQMYVKLFKGQTKYEI